MTLGQQKRKVQQSVQHGDVLSRNQPLLLMNYVGPSDCRLSLENSTSGGPENLRGQMKTSHVTPVF